MQFVGLTLEDEVPDNSVLSRFRTTLTQKNAYEPLMDLINGQLEAKGIVLKKGAIVDASITDSPRKPRGKKEYEQVATDREESTATTAITAQTTTADNVDGSLPAQPPFIEKIQSHVDTEGAWVKKAGKLRYGYKKHAVTDEQGLVLAVVTTAANESDVQHLEDVVSKAKLPKGIRVRADKGYCSKSNRAYLGSQGLKDGIMHKAVRNKKLSGLQTLFNKIVSKVRYRVERTFGGMSRWFNAGTARYVGKAKTHTQHIMEGLAYNLYRSPGIVVLNQLNAQSNS
jgi:IS5 family transposase